MIQKKSTNKSTKKREQSNPVFQVKESILLMDFLIKNLTDKSRNNIKTLLKDGQIWVNDIKNTQFNHPLLPGNTVEIRKQKSKGATVIQGIQVIYEDDYVIVIDKNSGVLSMATEKRDQVTAYSLLSDYVKKRDSDAKVFILHRLDRETSGVMVYAKSQKIQEWMQRDWQKIVTERIYLAIVSGHPQKKSGTITSYLKENKSLKVYSSQDATEGQLAITHYETHKTNKHYSLLKVNPETGRKNQIRVHMQDMGHPIVGDKKYGSNQNPISRLGLHAWVLAFIHPVTNKLMRFESPVPKKFSALFVEKPPKQEE
ncbi:MAG: RluA family pseudouridine synthase [Salinivirgaceae bacterium]|nr:RluA family pseudouridine synthase [Salinivirgaceae bacterium]